MFVVLWCVPGVVVFFFGGSVHGVVCVSLWIAGAEHLHQVKAPD